MPMAKGAWVAACKGDRVVDEVAMHELEMDMYSATAKKSTQARVDWW